ncbi:MAG: hypothetical protein ACE5OZ_01015 [Candidatus Heimdallarchaeota archaeon]
MTNDEVGRMLAEFAELKALLLKKLDAHEQFKRDILQEVRGLNAKLELLQLSSARRPTTSSLLAEPGKETDVLALMQLDLPHHLRPVYAVALDHGLVTAEMVSEETGLSTPQASASLKDLHVEYGILEWRKGDKKKDESTRKKYYYPVEPSSPITPSATLSEKPGDKQTEFT